MEGNNTTTTKEYIEKHIEYVRKHLAIFIALLRARSIKHDDSKLQEPEFSLWCKMDEEPRYEYGSDKYIEKMKKHAKVFNMHYKNNRHHPEHFSNLGILGMNLVDIIEMLCDWLGYKEKLSVKEAIDIVDKQMKRYNFSEDLSAIIKNTLIDYFSVLKGFENESSLFYKMPYDLLKELGFEEITCIKNLKKEGNIVDILA